MTFGEAIFLGFLQGITEFFPISSSGHLVLAEKFLGIELHPEDLLGFEILLHAGTAFALVFCYWETWLSILRSLVKPDQVHRRLLSHLVVATVPAGIAGVLFADTVATRFHTVGSVASALFLTACVLLMAHATRVRSSRVNATWKDILLMSVAQAFAIVPGLSRSGLTISAGQMSGLKREAALDFSFMMLLPVLCGAMTLLALDVLSGDVVLPPFPISFAGFVVSCITSAGAILFLRRFVLRQGLAWFTLYLLPLSCGLLLMDILKL